MSSEWLVVDPEWKEEKVQSGRITMTLNAHRELCAIQKAGGVPLSVDQILEYVSDSKKINNEKGGHHIQN